jgi:hypothetical protein
MNDSIDLVLFEYSKGTPEKQCDMLSPVLSNILKMTIRTLSTKRTKKRQNSFISNSVIVELR